MISGQLYISWANNQWVVSKKDGSCSTSSSSLEAAVLQSWSLAQQNQQYLTFSLDISQKNGKPLLGDIFMQKTIIKRTLPMIKKVRY